MKLLHSRPAKVVLGLLALAVVLFFLLPFFAPPGSRRPRPLTELMAGRRTKAGLPVEEIVRSMGIQPGMRILEVGASDGRFSLAMARLLAGGGVVYAADFESGPLAKLAREAGEAGLTNLIPVKISPRWDTGFYRDKRFDIVLLNDVYDRLPDPEAQLDGLSRVMNGRSARLFALRPAFLPPFDTAMDYNPELVLEVLREHGRGSPFYTRLPPELQQLVTASRLPGAVDQLTNRRIVEFLNRCLNDQSLYEDLDPYYARHSKVIGEYMKAVKQEQEAHVLRYFLYNFAPAFDKGAAPANQQEQFALYTANHLLLTCIFSLPRDCPFYAGLNFYRPDNAFHEAFRKAGFRTASQRKVSSAYTLWEFGREAE